MVDIYSITQPLKTMPFAATCMDLEIIILNEVSQTEKERYCMTSFIRGI